MALIKQLISKDKYDLKCTYQMKPTGICVHNTANNTSARNEIKYMQNNTSSTSFHIAIDDIEAIQGLPFDRNSWSCGDGLSGVGNRNFISIEICYSLSGGDKFTKAEKRASKEIALLLKEYNWGIDRVKKHQDFSNKYCPHRTLDLGWQRFLDMIQTELNKLKGVEDMNKLVVYFGDIDLFSAVIVSQKFGCPVMKLDHYKTSGLKAKEVIQIGGNPNEKNRFETFKNAGKLL